MGDTLKAQILVGHVLVRIKDIPDSSVDSIVTDPPYELGFMGKSWDSSGIAYSVPMWTECLRVLKPGGHLLSFGGSRTYHRMACAIEDAGFEIRDQIQWIFGSGFPKSRNLDGEWEGWGTGLKPAHEPVALARKPFRGSVAKVVRDYRAGVLNINGCRIQMAEGESNPSISRYESTPQQGNNGWDHKNRGGRFDESAAQSMALGRWPANVIHDGSEEIMACFPSEAGAAAPVHRRNGDKFRNAYGTFAGDIDEQGSTFHTDSGSAARFFYTPKTDRAERNAGCESMDEKPMLWSSGTQNPGSFQAEGTKRSSENNHPTVKPVDLMCYLTRLITPPGGTVLDPFTGSGSTGIAAMREGFNFIGIELSADYAAIAERRIAFEAPMFNQVTVE